MRPGSQVGKPSAPLDTLRTLGDLVDHLVAVRAWQARDHAKAPSEPASAGMDPTFVMTPRSVVGAICNALALLKSTTRNVLLARKAMRSKMTGDIGPAVSMGHALRHFRGKLSGFLVVDISQRPLPKSQFQESWHASDHGFRRGRLGQISDEATRRFRGALLQQGCDLGCLDQRECLDPHTVSRCVFSFDRSGEAPAGYFGTSEGRFFYRHFVGRLTKKHHPLAVDVAARQSANSAVH